MGISAKFAQVQGYIRKLSLRRRLALLGLLLFVGLLLTGLGSGSLSSDQAAAEGVPGEHEFDDINNLLATFEGDDAAPGGDMVAAADQTDDVESTNSIADGLRIPAADDSVYADMNIQSVSQSALLGPHDGLPEPDAHSSANTRVDRPDRRPIRLSGTIFPIH